MTTPDTDVKTDASETADEALAALARANTPPPTPPVVNPAAIERQRAALHLIAVLSREPAPQVEVEKWFATRPAQHVLEGLGLALGEPMADACRPVRLVDIAILDGQRLLEAPRPDQLERLRAELTSAVDPVVIEALAAEAERVATAIRSAKSALPSWRLRVKNVEDAMRAQLTTIQIWLDDCQRARTGSA
jgi:hypothetical protein